MKMSKREIFVALIAFAIVGSFVALVIAHMVALCNKEYYQSIASQETTFIAALTLGLMIVLLLPYIINEEQVKRNIKQEVKKEIENYWKNKYQKDMDKFINKSDLFINKSERDYAHTSRMIAYLLKQKNHYYWAMTWAGDSVVAYIRCFKEHPADFQLNREYFAFSLKIMKISFKKRREGSFLEDNMDLEHDSDSKKDKLTLDKIKEQIFEGKKIMPDDQRIRAVKELKRVILRYIKWQCFIYIEMQEHEKLSDDVINVIEEHLDSTFKKNFRDMVNNILKSFYYDEEKVDDERFLNDIVKKVELEEEKEKVRKYLKKILEGNATHQ